MYFIEEHKYAISRTKSVIGICNLRLDIICNNINMSQLCQKCFYCKQKYFGSTYQYNILVTYNYIPLPLHEHKLLLIQCVKALPNYCLKNISLVA